MLHMQRTVPNWDDCLHLLPNGSMVKATGGYEMFSTVKAINPKLFTTHRMVRGPWQTYQGSLESGWFDWEEAKRLARLWFNGFVDGTFREKIEQHCDSVSWHNEIWADSQNPVEKAELIAATEAAVHVWNTEYRPTFSHDIKLIIGEAAPGNGMPRRVAELAIDSGNIVGYHPYEWWTRKERSDAGWRMHTSMRFDLMEREWGLGPEWAFTECGPLESAVTGWRAPECLGGDSDLYIEAVRLWLVDVAKTAAYKQDRIRGFALFTTFTANDGKWGSFHTEQPELNRLAKMVANNWNPGGEAPTNPDPLPDPHPTVFEKMAWEATVSKQVTGQGGLRLNPSAGIQQQINRDNLAGINLQVVTDEVLVAGRIVQAAESLTGQAPRRVYVWEEGKKIYYFEEG